MTGLCLAVASGDSVPDDYTNVVIDNCDAPMQELWHMAATGEILHASSGHCLDEDTNTDHGGNNDHQVELFTCIHVKWQRWGIHGDNTIVNRDTKRCLDIQ